MLKKNKIQIGLEIHVGLQTKYKLFSSSPNANSEIENSNVSFYDIGMVGCFPHLNIEAVRLALKTCRLLDAKIAENVVFDRKHYRYPDLPLGYQITQHRHPIGRNGKYEFYTSQGKKEVIRIIQLHLEADAGKMKQLGIVGEKHTIDFNRVGSPLIEIVTDKDFHSADQVVSFLKFLISDLMQNNISDCKMFAGHLRVDVNISTLKENGEYSARWEIKNINSVNDIARAINLAEVYQLDSEYTDVEATFSYNKNTLEFMRRKESTEDYMYMVDFMLEYFPTANIAYDSRIERSVEIYRFINEELKFDPINSMLITCNPYIRSIYQELILIKNNKMIMNIIDTVLLIGKEIGIDEKTLGRVYEFSYYMSRLLHEKQIINVNRRRVIKEYIQHRLESGTELNYIDFIETNKLLYDSQTEIDNDTEKHIEQYLDENKELVERAKEEKSEKRINYMIGQIRSKLTNINIDILKKKLIEKIHGK